MQPGNTPLVEFRNLAPEGTRLFAKLEWYNPTGSIKDRPAWFMFHNAVESGRLRDGEPIVEATSGNTGIGLTRLAVTNGHPIAICIPASATEERKLLLRSYGADLIEVDGAPADALARAQELADDGEGVILNQYVNRWNAYAHFFGTSMEIVREWPLDAPAGHLHAAYGTGGTLTGNSRGLAHHWPGIRVHSVEPFYEDPISGMRSQDDPYQPPVADLSLVTDRHQVARATAEAMVLETIRAEGHFVGTSSGAIIHAALETLSREGGTSVMLLPDAGWKYLSNEPWTSI
ncbi:MAG: cysteine synthase family protein [Acidimicrobiia bacterium]|nr:MAG: cysteine synthase family protein [Acidimicrobiia bacterium]